MSRLIRRHNVSNPSDLLPLQLQEEVKEAVDVLAQMVLHILAIGNFGYFNSC